MTRAKKQSAKALAGLRREKAVRSAQLAKAKKWKPGSTSKDKIVFLSAETGRPTKGDVNRRKGFMVYVSPKGKVQFLTPKGKKEVRALRYESFEPEMRPSKKIKQAAEKFYAPKMQVAVLRETKHKGAVGWKNVEAVALGELKKFTKKYRGNKKVLFKVKLKAGKRNVGFSLALSYAQLQDLKAGRYEWIRGYLWKGISTELAQENLVTEGSANYIKNLKRNKGKAQSKWRTKNGELWGKGKYRRVSLSDIETKIFTLKK